MKIAVCVKQIPDPSGPGRLDSASHLMVREGVEMVLDPGDAYGVEAALALAEGGGAEVSAISMGGEKAVEVIRKAMAMGASEGLLVSDPRLRGSDALATARVLARAVLRSGAELVIAGTESTDGYTGTVPAAMAELLGWPCLTFARKLELDGSKVRIEQQTADGYDVLEAELPAVVTVTGGINEPRYPTLKGIMAARSKPLDQPSLEELQLDPAELGSDRAAQMVLRVEPAAQRSAGEILEDQGDAASRVADYLASLKVI